MHKQTLVMLGILADAAAASSSSSRVQLCDVCSCHGEELRRFDVANIPTTLVGTLWQEDRVPADYARLCNACAVPCCVATKDGEACHRPILRHQEVLWADTRKTLAAGVVVSSQASWNGDRAQLCHECAQPAKMASTIKRDTTLECSTTRLGKVKCCHTGKKALRCDSFIPYYTKIRILTNVDMAGERMGRWGRSISEMWAS